jgi:hypothetical protein
LCIKDPITWASTIREEISLMVEMSGKTGQIRVKFSAIYLKNMKIGLMSILNGKTFPYYKYPPFGGLLN